MQPGKIDRPTGSPGRLRLGFLITILLGLVAAVLAFKMNLFSVNVLKPIFDVILKHY